MKLSVEAPVTAALLRTERSESVLAAALVVRKRFGLVDGGLVEDPVGKAPAAIRYDAVDKGEFGELPPDEIPPRNGTDVIVLGDAVATEATIASRVEVRVGEYHVALDVFGDRVWDSVLGALVPSNPAPFTRMPLTYANAYGGAAEGEYGPIPWYMNPVGKGYFLKSGEAKGKSLPNVELASAHIKSWDDRPPPAGLAPYPAQWGLRWEKFVELHPEREQVEVHPERGLYDRAHPMLSGKPVTGGAMSIKGMSERPIAFELPACPVEAHIRVGAASVVRDLELEEIVVDVREGLVDLTWRKMFRYPFVPHEKRETRVVEKALRPR